MQRNHEPGRINAPLATYRAPAMAQSVLARVELAPRDPIRGVTDAFNADPNPRKGVHLIWAGEKVRADYPLPSPMIDERVDEFDMDFLNAICISFVRNTNFNICERPQLAAFISSQGHHFHSFFFRRLHSLKYVW